MEPNDLMSATEEESLDSLLLAIENPVRRKIIKRLSREPSYQLQISKELGFSQQLVAKHLDAMEDSGLVASLMEASPHGPKRKEYLLNKSVSLTVDLAPNLFRARLFAFDSIHEPEGEQDDLFRDLNDVIQRPEESGKLKPLGSLISEIDRKLEGLEDERSLLLYLRNLAMKQVANAISGMPISWDAKRILYHVVDEHDRSVDGISRSLNLRDSWVRETLARLEKNL